MTDTILLTILNTQWIGVEIPLFQTYCCFQGITSLISLLSFDFWSSAFLGLVHKIAFSNDQ